ncbi:MAG: hypothetical protein DWQ02_08625 [Bacteroidetes bacterium]|nr:MAG: hypothetical protein DWQ02_08625 [Bacteroidota bacterium]
MTRKQRNILNFLALLFLLIVLPVAALYFLDMGVDYRKELLAELGDHGQAPEFSLVSVNGDTINQNSLKNHIALVNFMGFNQGSLQEDVKGQSLKKLNGQFGDREEVIFLNFISKSASDSLDFINVRSFLESNELETCEKCYFVFAGKSEMESLATDGFGMTFENGMNVLNNASLALCDKTGTIKRYYNLEDKADEQLLVRHVIMFLPAGEGREGDFEIIE